MFGLFFDPRAVQTDATGKDDYDRESAGPALRSRAEIRRAGSTPVVRMLQVVRDLLEYWRARAAYREATTEFDSLFRRFVTASEGGRCLRLAFDGDTDPELGKNWVTLSLDQVERRARVEGRVRIDLEDQYFDSVLCTGLGWVSRPASLLNELHRVLKGAGQLWIQVPLSGPYRPAQQAGRTEYWRITPDGLRMLLDGFDEIFCAVYLPRTTICASSFYYGLKPQMTSAPTAFDAVSIARA